MRNIAVNMVLVTAVALSSCKPYRPEPTDGSDFGATPYNLVIPPLFPPMDIPADNPLTVEGVELGRYLFWEKKLSANNTQSCGSCHLPESHSDARAASC